MILRSLTYKKRWYLLLVGIVIMTIIIWRMTLSRTLRLVDHVKKAKIELKEVEIAPIKARQLESALKDLGTYTNEGADSAREELLKLVGDLCNKHHVELIHFNEPITGQEAGYETVIHKVRLTGSFHDLARSLYDIEEQYRRGDVVSVHYFLQKDRRRGSTRLLMDIWLQQIRKPQKYYS